MKKIIIASVLGVAAGLFTANNANAQGQVVFCNYSSVGEVAAVTFASGPNAGLVVGSGFYANLLYSFGANLGVTYSSLDLGQTVPVQGTIGGNPFVDGSGLFGSLSTVMSIPGYSSGAIDFIVQVYDGNNYSSAATYSGQSGVIQLTDISTTSNGKPVGGFFASDNPNQVVTGIQNFTVTPVPEPATLALAGLGGFGMLMALRRKKA